jgi:hypothetical protein
VKNPFVSVLAEKGVTFQAMHASPYGRSEDITAYSSNPVENIAIYFGLINSQHLS